MLRNDEVDLDAALRLRRRPAVARARARPRRPGSASTWSATPRAASRSSASASGTRRSAVAYGATVTRAPELLHGKTSQVHHRGVGVLAGLPDPVHGDPLPLPGRRPGHRAGRARGHRRRTASGVVMAMRHREVDVEGVQFHPESVLTEGGHRMLANWLVAVRRPRGGAAVDRPRARRRLRLTDAPHPSSILSRWGPLRRVVTHLSRSSAIGVRGSVTALPVGVGVGVDVAVGGGATATVMVTIFPCCSSVPALGLWASTVPAGPRRSSGSTTVSLEPRVGQVGLGLLPRGSADHRRHRHLAARHRQSDRGALRRPRCPPSGSRR